MLSHPPRTPGPVRLDRHEPSALEDANGVVEGVHRAPELAREIAQQHRPGVLAQRLEGAGAETLGGTILGPSLETAPAAVAGHEPSSARRASATKYASASSSVSGSGPSTPIVGDVDARNAATMAALSPFPRPQPIRLTVATGIPR